MHRTLFTCVLVCVAAGSALTFDAIAAGDQSVAAVTRAKLLPVSTAKPPVVAPLPPQQLYLIRAALGALNDANATGNYSVLRDLAAPSFQAKHSAADLAEIFAVARRKPVDLAPAAYLMPVVTDAARPDPSRLHLTGHVPGTFERITFQLHFEAVAGHWRIASLSIGTAKN